MDLSKVNAAGKGKAESLPLVALNTLKVNESHLLTNIYKVNTKYGEKIMVNLDEEKTTFLPTRMVKFFEQNPDEWYNVQEAVQKYMLFMIYRGGRYNSVEFETLNSTTKMDEPKEEAVEVEKVSKKRKIKE